MTPDEYKEAIEHRNVLEDLRAILATNSGKRFFKYLFKHLEVAEVPPLGLEGNLLMDKLGYLRAGNSIFALAAEADSQIVGQLLAQKEKERHEALYANALGES